MNISFISFGCKVNISEINTIMANLEHYDVDICENIEKADLIIVNTCAVTEKAQKNGEKYLKKLKNKYPTLKIVAMGCLAELLKEKMLDIGVDIFIPNNKKNGILDNLGIPLKSNKTKSAKHTTREFLKIQDGCNCACTYCIIPQLRGPSVSVHKTEVLERLRTFLNVGCKEIVLTGIHIGLYEDGIAPLLQYLLNNTKEYDYRLRLTSLYINEIDANLIDTVNNSSKLAQHFHISLQSGSDSVLKRMGRVYKTIDFINTLKLIRSKMPDAFIGIDIITGFPGETEDEFNETVSLLEKLPKDLMLDGMHIFPYSIRPKTVAASMDNQISQIIKKERAAKIKTIADKHKNTRESRMIGKTLRILAEKGNKGHAGNYFLVFADEITENEFYDIKIIDLMKNGLLGKK